jgi:omega-amidase
VLRVALGEYDIGWHDPAGSLDRAAQLVAGAAGEGAELVVLPEMCTTGFTMEADAQCEPLDGRSVQRLAEIARRSGVHLLAGVATRETAGNEGGQRGFFNSALLFDARGDIAAHYRKQKLFVFAEEQQHYSPGDAPVVVEVAGVRLAPFICFDLRYPELFRAVAPEVDAMLLIANWPAARRPHWDALTRARAIENQCYFVAVNRTGEGGGIDYDGGSVAFDPWGERMGGGREVVTIDPARVGEVRGRYPFVEDLR